MLPYNDVWVVLQYLPEDTLVKGVYSSEYLAQLFLEKLLDRGFYYGHTEANFGIVTHKLNSMEV